MYSMSQLKYTSNKKIYHNEWPTLCMHRFGINVTYSQPLQNVHRSFLQDVKINHTGDTWLHAERHSITSRTRGQKTARGKNSTNEGQQHATDIYWARYCWFKVSHSSTQRAHHRLISLYVRQDGRKNAVTIINDSSARCVRFEFPPKRGLVRLRHLRRSHKWSW